MRNQTTAVKRSGQMPVRTFRLCFFLLLAVSVISVTPAFGIRLVTLNPLFEITRDFNAPSEVSVGKDGRVYVVDGVNSKIKVFDRNGKYLFSFGRPGAANGQFNSALGIDIDTAGRVYIADSGNHRVQIFEADGTFIRQIPIPPAAKHAADPTDVAVDEDRNRCYVVDNDNHRILVYDLATLAQNAIYGGPGEGRRAFRYPFLIALNKEKELHIVDVINTRVQVLNPEGLFIKNIGGWGVEKGNFFRPKGVAVDRDNRVYVSDSYLGVVQVFGPDGEFYAALGDAAGGVLKKFTTPVGLFIDDGNRLYVVEMRANKVSVYQIGDATGQN